MADPNPRLSLASLFSVLLGPTGPFGILVGYWGLYQINSSDGRLRGRSFAYTGIGLGTASTAALILGFVAIGLTQVRATSGRAECMNNLRMVGGAVQKYHDDHDKTYPPGTAGPSELPPDQRLSLHAALLPYLEQRPGISVNYAQVARTLDFKQGWEAGVHTTARSTAIPSYVCRGDANLPPDRRGLTTYVGITGVGPDAARLPKDSPRAGFFGYDRTVRDGDVKPGTSYLIMLTETAVDNGPWLAAGLPTLREVPAADDMSPFGPGRPFGGLHRDGAYVLHVDGSVLFFTDTMQPEVFRSLVRLQHE